MELKKPKFPVVLEMYDRTDNELHLVSREVVESEYQETNFQSLAAAAGYVVKQGKFRRSDIAQIGTVKYFLSKVPAWAYFIAGTAAGYILRSLG